MPLDDALAPGSHTIRIQGIEQRYHIAGQGPLCIAHSGGPGVDWAYLKMPLVERHLTMLYIEPIGTGESGYLAQHPQGYSVDRFSLQLEGFVEALGLSGFFMLGHSHGGFVVQQFAVEHPKDVAGMILYATSAVTGAEFMKDAGLHVAAFAQRHASSPEADEVAQAWSSFSRVTSDEDYTAMLRKLLPVYFADHRRQGLGFDEFRSALRASLVVGDGAPFDVREALSKLQVPALILVGMHDFICGAKWADILSDALPESHLVRFAHSGHLPHIEEPEAFADAVAAFVRRRGLVTS
jgi:pimeloyl-ACP methyl ester carboxylesterase